MIVRKPGYGLATLGLLIREHMSRSNKTIGDVAKILGVEPYEFADKLVGASQIGAAEMNRPGNPGGYLV